LDALNNKKGSQGMVPSGINARAQGGVSLSGFMVVVAFIALLAVVGMKVVPTVVEFSSIKKALTSAKNAGSTAGEIKAAFDKQSSVGYIDSVSGKDLEVKRNGDGFDVSVAYEKKISLFGPVSLLIDYQATTSPR